MTALPEWMYPPRVEGWYAKDLDHLPDAPKHTELIDGALIFALSPRPAWHARVVTALNRALAAHAPKGVEIEWNMTVRLDRRNRAEPDLLATTAPFLPQRTWFEPDDVALTIEVVSPESAERDRKVKFRKYAEAGIPHYWVVEREHDRPVVHVYELDGPTGTYAPAGIFRGTLDRPVPFPVTLGLDSLVPAPRRAGV
ncbi:Uma2 family endonuclease [Nocardiopsis sediminis]|uniref:Uma2 family endonuclease n=1 Tax=Nocardiopsis sediminis TaxID=1778267 RepID=A0ABV8FQE7_9ACTN